LCILLILRLKAVTEQSKIWLEIEAAASNAGRDFSSVARDLLVEAVKMKKCPGIIFADGPTGRRARVSGTGIDVWEIAAAFKEAGENYTELQKVYHWLSEPQLRSALSYYALYPAQIDGRGLTLAYK